MSFNRILLTTIFILFFGFILPLIFIFIIPGTISLNFIFSSLVVIWSSIRMGICGFKNRKNLTFMFFYVFVYVFLGIQPQLSAWAKNYPHKELSIQSDLYTYTTFLVFVGILAFEIGYLKIYNVSQSYKKVVVTEIPISKIILLICFISILVILSILYYGPNIYLSIRDGVSFNDKEGPNMSVMERQLIIDSLRVIVAIVLFITLYVKQNNINFHNKLNVKTLKYAVIYMIFLNILVSNPLNTARLWSGSVLLTSLFIVVEWKANSFFRWSTSLILIFLLLFSGLDPRKVISQTILRGDEISVSSTIQSVGEGILSLPYDANFDAFQIISYTELYIQKQGYSFGKQVLLPIFFWIPRSFWPNKPIGTSDVVGENAGFYSVNVSSSLWTEGYINFGIIGVIIFLYIFGRIAHQTDKMFSIYNRCNLFHTIFICYFAANTFILLRGDLTSGTMYLQMIVFFTFLILRFLNSNRNSDLAIKKL